MTEAQKLEILANLGVELNKVADLDLLMERILGEARSFVNADAGSIYIRNGDVLEFRYTQNATLQKRLPRGAKLPYCVYKMPIDETSIAGYVAHNARPLSIKNVYEIGENVPYNFNRSFDDDNGYKSTSMLTIPLITSRDNVLGVLQIINAQDDAGETAAFTTEDEKMMSHFAGVATVALERASMTRNMILRTIKMAEMRDPKETGAHVNRVGSYCVEIYEHWARRKGIPREEIDAARDVFRMAAMLHDVGKVGISDAILKKPARLTYEEFEVMKEHTVMGAALFSENQSEFDDAAKIVALNHHEKWNGAGYPGHVDYFTGKPLPGHENNEGRARGKVGEEIPLFGRIVAIADVYDALCSKRSYKPAWQESDALNVLEEDSGSHFDPDLIEIFFSCLDEIRSIRERYPDEEENNEGEEQKDS